MVERASHPRLSFSLRKPGGGGIVDANIISTLGWNTLGTCQTGFILGTFGDKRFLGRDSAMRPCWGLAAC